MRALIRKSLCSSFSGRAKPLETAEGLGLQGWIQGFRFGAAGFGVQGLGFGAAAVDG